MAASRPSFAVARGITRTVLLTPRYAIKVPTFRSWKLFLTGLLANMQEAQFSGVWPELCPVLRHIPGGFMVVMPRAEPVVDEGTWDDVLGTIPPHIRDMCESKPQNYGYLDGKLVGVDYGGGGL